MIVEYSFRNFDGSIVQSVADIRSEIDTDAVVIKYRASGVYGCGKAATDIETALKLYMGYREILGYKVV